MRPKTGGPWPGAAISAILRAIRASYWFIPAALTTLALLLGLGSVALDRALGPAVFTTTPFGGRLDPDGARGILSIAAQSIFGVTGVMFSMTIVAVSFATGKFGPRLIGNFMRDRVNQWSLAALTATFVFALVVMRSVRAEGGTEAAFVPQVSILIVLLLTLMCVGVVIYFVHHVPEMIDISRLTAAIGRRLLRDIDTLARAQAEAAAASEPAFVPPEGEPDAAVMLGKCGYVQTLDLDRLRDLAREHRLGIAVDLPAGAFATTASVALRVWGGRPDDETASALRDCFALGDGPTADDNLRHLLDQLVEISARALSPGVNDPFTAINCLNWIHAAAVAAAHSADGLTGAQAGPVHKPAMRFADVLAAGFGASRPYTRSDPLCDAHLRAVLDRLGREIVPGPHRETLRRFAGALDDDA